MEVGYQPEGIACYNGNLYVANSGGLALPPTYSYDNTVSIIDAASFAVKKEVEVQINLKNVYSDGKGNIYVTTMGNYYDVHSGLYMFKAASPDSPVHIADNVSVSTINGDTVYCIGTETEFLWGADHSYSSFTVKNGVKTPLTLNLTHNTPYSIGVLNENTIFVGELALSSYEDEGETKWSSDYFNPDPSPATGTVTSSGPSRRVSAPATLQSISASYGSHSIDGIRLLQPFSPADGYPCGGQGVFL